MDDNNTILTTSTNILIEGVQKDTNLTAVYVRDSFNIILETNPKEGGIALQSGLYGCGIPVDIVATANECYEFIN